MWFLRVNILSFAFVTFPNGMFSLDSKDLLKLFTCLLSSLVILVYVGSGRPHFLNAYLLNATFEVIKTHYAINRVILHAVIS